MAGFLTTWKCSYVATRISNSGCPSPLSVEDFRHCGDGEWGSRKSQAPGGKAKDGMRRILGEKEEED